METFFTAISNFGFPVVVAGYLLFRFENKVEKLTESISGSKGLISTVNKLANKVDRLTKKIK